jgi:hypothetical protein
MKKLLSALFLLTSFSYATPILEMNNAFRALNGLIPFIVDEKQFDLPTNEKLINGHMQELELAFKNAKHENLLKQDVFAPSYAVINEHIAESKMAFVKGKKDYARWRLKELTSLCLDCHTRLPESHPSSFQTGELRIDDKKFDNKFNLGIAQLIVRRYPDAKQSFTEFIDEKMIAGQPQELPRAFKQLLLIDLKVLKKPADMEKVTAHYLSKKQLPQSLKTTLKKWNKQLKIWVKREQFISGIKDEKTFKRFLHEAVDPVFKNASYSDEMDVDLLMISGILSRYLFENPQSTLAPELNYWLGRSEKYLKREQFFGAGDGFLKQCIRRYPTHPVAKKCLEEYEESVRFEFSGSSGTSIPVEIQEEINHLKNMIKNK